MHFGCALDLSDIDLSNMDLLHQRYTHLDLFVSKTSSRHVFKTSSRHVFKTFLQDVFKTCLQDVICVTIFRFPRRLQGVFKTFSEMSSRRFQDVFTTSLQDEKLLHWRHVVDVFKACLEDVFKTFWRPANVCRESCYQFQAKFLPGKEGSGTSTSSATISTTNSFFSCCLWRRRRECYTYLGQLFLWSTTLLSSEKISEHLHQHLQP